MTIKNEGHYQRLLKVPSTSFFLLGLRGVGKSTWARQQFADAHHINLLDEGLYQLYLTRPSAFGEDLSNLKPKSWVIVDEIQRLPNLLNEVHRAIEERKLRFALLGSSARKLRRAGVNLLGGRAQQKYLHPLLPEELGFDFSLDRVLCYGSIPLIWTAPDPKEQLSSYVQLYLKQEIQAEALVRNLPGFARFLPVAALFHGQLINVESLGRDAGVARSTVEGFLQILEDTLLIFRLPAYEPRLRARQKRHPKLYWNDPGVVRATKQQLGPVAIEEKGSLFEGFIAQVIRHSHELGLLEYDQLSYWSAGKNSVEVDFILERGSERIGIEAKAGDRISSDWFAGLKSLKESGHLSRAVLVYTGQRRFTHASGVEICPLIDFLQELTKW